VASFAYHSFLQTALKGDLDFDTVTFKCALTTSSYTPDKDHDFFNDVTNEVAASGTYAAGGGTATVTVTRDTANDRIDISLGAVSFTSATITARYGVYYVERAGASSTDDLVAVIDFGSDVTSTAGTWALTASTLRFQF